MATLILGTVGRAVGGPVGGLIGTFVGASLDSAVLGGGRAVGRIANLAVQSSAYGEPIPRLYGMMRAAGNLVWTAGIVEHSGESGGKGGTTTEYSYTASFAVLLSARPIASVRRVWADGKLIRDAAGAWLSPITMRMHAGGDGEAIDPLIAAAEGSGGTPAYRGLAYAVFEDLPLADYGNRIPNLTFEIVADGDGTDAGAVLADLAMTAALDEVGGAGTFPHLTGFAAARAGSVRSQLVALTSLHDLRFVDDGAALVVRAGSAAAGPAIAAQDLGSTDGTVAAGDGRREVRAAAGQIDDAVAIGFSDPARDYQAGLQRAVRRADAARVTQIDIDASLDAATAKRLASDILARRSAARLTGTLHLPLRALAHRAGEVVACQGDPRLWSARRWTFSNFLCELAVERMPARSATLLPADGGRVHDAGDAAPGPTMLHVFELPSLAGEVATTPRLWVAAAGGGPAWRRSGLALSLDGGASYVAAGEAAQPAVIGTTLGPLAATEPARWDRAGTIDVELLGEAMWLDSRGEDAVLAGANLALIGSEIVQFANVQPLGNRRFRLTNWLRGRRASAVAAHAAGERFVLLDAARLVPLDVPLDAVGRSVGIRPTGSGDVATTATAVVVSGLAMQPLAPVRLQVAADGGDLVFRWIRRSRAGSGWVDFVDAPLSESSEAYSLTLALGSALVRSANVSVATWRYAATDRAADGAAAGTAAVLSVRQLGSLGGVAATATFVLP